MRIEVIFDTVCPWCFIGKRRLERALRLRPAIAAELVWRPFLLNPELPEEGISRRVYLERKFGGPARVSRMLASLREAGASEGITFDFDAIPITPNTIDSHRLIAFAARYGKATDVVERLFQAYFYYGRNIGQIETLCALAEEAGLSGSEFSSYIAHPDHRQIVLSENNNTHRLSINGVPCFIFEGTYGIAGAQEADILVRMLDLTTESRAALPLSAASPDLSHPPGGSPLLSR